MLRQQSWRPRSPVTVPLGEGDYDSVTGTVDIAGSIVSDSPSGGDCSGDIKDAGYNLDDDGTCSFSSANHSLSDTNPDLGPLADNGGLTDTQYPDRPVRYSTRFLPAPSWRVGRLYARPTTSAAIVSARGCV